MAAYAVATVSAVVSWAFQFACVGLAYAGAGGVAAAYPERVRLRVVLLLIPWVATYGAVSVFYRQTHVYPILAIGVVGAVVGAAVVRNASAHPRAARLSGALLVGLVILGGWIGMPNWLAATLGTPDRAPSTASQVHFEFREGSERSRLHEAPASFHGTVTVLDFWATSCVACFEGFPNLEKLYRAYEKDPRVRVLAVNLTEPEDPRGRAQRMMEKRNYAFGTLYSSMTLQEASLLYGFLSIPSVVIYDPTGRIAFVGSPKFGPIAFINNVEQEVEILLEVQNPG